MYVRRNTVNRTDKIIGYALYTILIVCIVLPFLMIGGVL